MDEVGGEGEESMDAVDPVEEGGEEGEHDDATDDGEPELGHQTGWSEVAIHHNTNKALKPQVKQVLAGRAVAIMAQQFRAGPLTGDVPYLLAYCRHCADHRGNVYCYSYRFEFQGGELVEYGFGQHFPHLCQHRVRARQRRLLQTRWRVRTLRSLRSSAKPVRRVPPAVNCHRPAMCTTGDRMPGVSSGQMVDPALASLLQPSSR